MNSQQQILKIPLPQKISQIFCGSHHSLALSTAKSGLYLWGKSSSCNLSFHTPQPYLSSPQYIDIKVQNVSTSNQHTFIWTKNQVYCWGMNNNYKLGLPQIKQYQLQKLGIFNQAIQAGMQLQMISCGDQHSIAVFKLEQQIQQYSKENGKQSIKYQSEEKQHQQKQQYQIFAWGDNKNYQLAIQAEGIVNQPIMIDFTQNIDKVYSRNDYNFIVTKAGKCYTWGCNIFSRLGIGNNIKNQKYPIEVKIFQQIPTKISQKIFIQKIAMGKYHCIAIIKNKNIYTWGHGLHGQLGLNQIISQANPTKINLQKNVNIIDASCGQYHSLILTQNRDIMSCGTNAYFGLGHRQVDEKKRCKKFMKINFQQGQQFIGDRKNNKNQKIKKIASGNRHNLLLTQNGDVFSWGCNKFGQLGRNTQENGNNQLIRKQLYKNIDLQNQNVQKNNISTAEKKFKQINDKKQFQSFENKLQEKQKVFQIRESKLSIKGVKQSQNIKQTFSQGKDKQQLLLNWKKRYEQFKKQQQQKQKQFMEQLYQIISKFH